MPHHISSAINEWTPGGANFVFLSLGYAYQGNSFYLESKTTRNSVSDLELTPFEQNSVELEISRAGATITTRYRFAEGLEWLQADVFDRPDMPETLQVGLVGYTDYAKASSFTPLYANANTLIDSPANTTASSNANLPYNPDLRATFDYIRFERPTTDNATNPAASHTQDQVTTSLVVQNASFEDITGETPWNEFTFGPIPGWNLYDPHNITSGGDGPAYYIGTLAPSETPAAAGELQHFPSGATDGQRVGIAFNRGGHANEGEYGLQQTLSTVLTPHTTYSLSVDIGNIATGTSLSGQTFLLDGFPGYRVDFMAGDTVLVSDNNSLAESLAEGEFQTTELTFYADAEHAEMGQLLAIRLVNLNQATGVPEDHDLEVDFDHVRLTATSSVFAQIGDQQVRPGEVLTVELPATMEDDTPIQYEVTVPSMELWNLDQTFGLRAGGYSNNGAPLYYESYGNYGVKWLWSEVEGWMFLQPDGSLRNWQSSLANSPLIASLDSSLFADPTALHDAQATVHATINEGSLSIVSVDGFVGSVPVSLSKTAGELSQTETFNVNVTNTAPIIPIIGNQTLDAGAVLTINLPTSDTDGDLITYEIEVVENIAASTRQTYGIFADASLVDADYGYNFLGQQERWVQSTSGWIYITPQGTVHLWNGNYATSPQVAHLDERYYQDPSLLVHAEHVELSGTFADGQLQVNVQNYTGPLVIRLTASDGNLSSMQEFTLLVSALPWETLVDAAFGEPL